MPSQPSGRSAKLITPHGDWEHRINCGTYPNSQSHYPSWGLGTRSSSALNPLGLRLITPHGDWELPDASTTTKGKIDSLPLMGIGNQLFCCRAGVDPHLITPHGDWERRSYLPNRRGADTHYPSWGLGTIIALENEGYMKNSLPLMGIGNVLEYFLSFAKAPLITPHGDWELR